MPVTIFINRLFVNFSQNVKIYHNNVLTVDKMPMRNLSIVQQTIDDRVDPFYIFEESLLSIPTNGRVPVDISSVPGCGGHQQAVNAPTMSFHSGRPGFGGPQNQQGLPADNA